VAQGLWVKDSSISILTLGPTSCTDAMGCGGSKAEEGGPQKSGSGSGAKKSGGEAVGTNTNYSVAPGNRIVLGKYELFMGKDGILGEGSFCTCRRGVNKETGHEVAIKTYKNKAEKARDIKVCLMKFKRQIEVLKTMQKPLSNTGLDARHWHTELVDVAPEAIFIQLVDYSREKDGSPGNDVVEGVAYVVTELAKYSMKDYLADCRERKTPLGENQVCEVTKQVVTVVGGLHSKGLVHLDLKPENLMMGRDRHWKLIDVDGCVKMNQKVSIRDSSISFSPCYCAPEWARFLIEDQDTLMVRSTLDVWSVGMTICELVSLDAILKSKYASFLRQGCSHREAGFFFMEWLGSEKKIPLPTKVEAYGDKQFLDLIRTKMLEPKWEKRATLCECFDHPFLKKAKGSATRVSEWAGAPTTKHRLWDREIDVDTKKPLFSGTLWKLNTDGDPMNPEHWLKRDMWISQNGNLCYFSMKENKKLIFMDRSRLLRADIAKTNDEDTSKISKPWGFQMKIKEDKFESVMFAAGSHAEREDWLAAIDKATQAEAEWFHPKTMAFNQDFLDDLRNFKLHVNNRRKAIEADSQGEGFDPVFKEKLWKLKGEGDPMIAEHWFLRDMWIGKNGSLCYFSEKSQTNMMHYSQQDLRRMTINKIEAGKAAKDHAFEIVRVPADGLEFEPGLFAAENQATRDKWITQFLQKSATGK